jgi:aspartyl aminopeptidase
MILCLFDHEEVGSESTTGAAGPMLENVVAELLRVRGLGDRRFDFLRRSLCISADNAHGLHPNYPERHDPNHAPLVNRGPALKRNANQRYATSAHGASIVRRIARDAGVPLQDFVSNNSMPCGSTIGPITATRLGIETVDIGVPQLAMHSARETCGAQDPSALRDLIVAAGSANY